MKVEGHLSGGAAYLRSYQVNATVSSVGIPLLIAAAAEPGLDLPTTTAVADMVGLNYDTATYATAQQSDNSDPAAYVRVNIRPDAVMRARLCGGATSGTALSQRTVSTAAADGLTVTTGDDWGSPEEDEGVIWGYDGANAGVVRKITSSSSTAATVTVAFPFDTVVGDNFLWGPTFPMDVTTVTMTSDFTEINAAAAVATNTAALLTVDLDLRPETEDGTIKSYILLMAGDHFLNRLS